MATTGVEQPLDTAAPSADAPWWAAIADGVSLLGPVPDSGLTRQTYLVRRPDGQMVQLSELLHIVLTQLDPARSAPELAQRISEAIGRRLTVEGLAHVVETRLEPLGLAVTGASSTGLRAPSGVSGTATRPPVARPLLALSLRGVIVPSRWVPRLGHVLAPFFWPPIVVGALLAAVLLDVAAFRAGDLGEAVTDVLSTPTLLLALYALLTLGGLIHETGHAAACVYGGGRPGAIGFGVYLLFPAFYTDVTDSYRLSRRGRLRTDLGGLYFNVWCLIVLATLYLQTGEGIFLLAALVMQIEMVQQLMPAVRLDGYYVLSDLIGVPDLFARVGPVVRSALARLRPGSPPVHHGADLRPRARRAVLAWVAFTVPLLVVGLGWLLWSLPFIVRTNLEALALQARQWRAAWAAGDVAVTALTSLSMLLLVVPLLGLAVLLHRLGLTVWRLVTRRPAPPLEAEMTTPPSHGETSATRPAPPAGPADLLTAEAFRDDLMMPPRQPVPSTGWRRAVYRASGRTFNLGPGPEERARLAIEARLRSPIHGSHRVAVMSRKGGVGKTTISFALGSTFAELRGDRVIAVDANPDAGNLAHRVALPSERTITDVLHDADDITSYAQLRTYTSQADESRLEVLASDDDPRIGMALGRDDYHRLIGLLDRFYNLIVIDTGTGILDSANQGLLTDADQLVLVLRPGIDGGRAAALTLDWLEEHGAVELVRQAVVVVNAVRKGVGAPIPSIVRHFEQRCRKVVLVPWDPALEVGALARLSDLNAETRSGLVAMAAAVADGFGASGAGR